MLKTVLMFAFSVVLCLEYFALQDSLSFPKNLCSLTGECFFNLCPSVAGCNLCFNENNGNVIIMFVEGRISTSEFTYSLDCIIALRIFSVALRSLPFQHSFIISKYSALNKLTSK